MATGERSDKDRRAGMLGMGLDNADGHTRLTRGENFLLLGGSQDTHERMQETAIKINEKLEKRGKRLEELSREEFRDIAREAGLKEKGEGDS